MLNEHDINDYTSEFAEYQPIGESKNLYELERGSFFKILGEDHIYRFSKVDGMYSVNHGVTEAVKDSGIFHFAVWTPVIEYVKQS